MDEIIGAQLSPVSTSRVDGPS